MKKIVLVFIILLIGCRSFDDKGRLEKIRLQVPALINIEFDYELLSSFWTSFILGYKLWIDVSKKPNYFSISS